MEEGTTYLEEFVQSVELLPNDIRRDFELMRVLDKECTEGMAELEKLESDFLVFIKCGEPECVDICSSGKDNGVLQEKMEKINSLRTRIKQKLAEKSAIATTINSYTDSYTRKLDADLAFFEDELRSCGEFAGTSGIEAGSDVAIRPSHLSSEWILGRVLYHCTDTGAYEVVDVDDAKVLKLPETQVVALDSANIETMRRLVKNDEVLAVYPDTSTFYPAVLAQAPRRASMLLGSVEPTALVQFIGDGQDGNSLPVKSVPLKHVIQPQS